MDKDELALYKYKVEEDINSFILSKKIEFEEKTKQQVNGIDLHSFYQKELNATEFSGVMVKFNI